MDKSFLTVSLPASGLQSSPLVQWLADGAANVVDTSTEMKDRLTTILHSTEAFRNVPATNWLVAVTIIGACLLYRAALPKPIRGIPYNHASANRLMGDVPVMLAKKKSGGISRSFFPELFSTQKAPVVQFFRGPFIAPAVAVGDYATAHNLLVKHGRDFTRGYTMKAMWRGIAPAHFVGMEASDPAQKATRELTKDLMTPAFLKEVNAPASYSKVLHFVDFWLRKMALAGGNAFDAELDLHALIYDVIMAAATNIKQSDTHIGQAMGRPAKHPTITSTGSKTSLAAFRDVEVDDLLQSLDVLSAMAGQSLTTPFPRLFYFFKNRKAHVKKAFRDRDTLISTYITDSVRRMHAAGGSEHFPPLSGVDFIVKREAIAAARDGRPPSFYTDTIIQVVFGYLLAGQDTTHSAICFLIKRLTSSQDKQHILRQELQKAFSETSASKRPPTQQEIIEAHLPYLDSTIEETLRMHPAAFGTTRQATKDIEVLGHTIPKGSAVFLSMTGATYTERGYCSGHKHKDTSAKITQQDSLPDWGLSPFPAGEFHPERWLKEDSETGKVTFNPKAGPMMSFSAGGRSCWGKRLAYLELRLIVSVLVWSFKFDALPEDLVDWSMTESLTVKPRTTRVLLRSV